MQAAAGVLLRSLQLSSRSVLRQQIRVASLTGAISRGIRRGQRPAESRRHGYDEPNSVTATKSRPRIDIDDTKAQSDGQGSRQDADYLTIAPRNIPYTAADSEFLYGLHAIEAVIKARRRKFHKLYVYSSDDGGIRSAAEKNLHQLAKEVGIQIVRVGGPAWKQKMSQLAGGRAHNGFVLEASPLPSPVIKSIGEVEYAGAPWQPDADPALPAINAKADNRFPLILLLDAITDTGNIGAILRSVYFFGVDGVIRTEFGSSSTANMLKASAGAAEAVPIFTVRNEIDFIRSAQSNGWHFATAVAPDAEVRVDGARKRKAAMSRHTSDRILDAQPTVLILGNEAEGVRHKLSRMSDSFISIQDAAGQHDGLDSLNVSIAAAILMRDLVNPYLQDQAKHPSVRRPAINSRQDDDDLF